MCGKSRGVIEHPQHFYWKCYVPPTCGWIKAFEYGHLNSAIPCSSGMEGSVTYASNKAFVWVNYKSSRNTFNVVVFIFFHVSSRAFTSLLNNRYWLM